MDARPTGPRPTVTLAEKLDAEYASILNDSGRSELQQWQLRQAFASGFDDQIGEWGRRAVDLSALNPSVRQAVELRRAGLTIAGALAGQAE